MKLPPRTPWFSAQSQPPVNGGPDAVYELRCLSPYEDSWARPKRWTRYEIETCACPHCQWRGLTKPAKEK